jgi:DNA-binding NtrC family response regulator
MSDIGLYSEDRTLFALLSSALGDNFHISLESNEEGMNTLASVGGCDVMVLDLNSSDTLRSRIECFRRLIKLPVPAIILGDHALRSTASELVRAGAFGYCCSPPSIRDLRTLLSRAHENSTLKLQLRATKGRTEHADSRDRLIGTSPQMRKVLDLIDRVKDVSVPVLVTGENGTGKELIARANHNLSSRARYPFVAISCSAIPETLIEAELFGHEKGAFTGAAGMREGYLEKAGTGTLLLDEIGDLSPLAQVKLLRVLQEMEFSRLGSSRLIPLRARLIFATNRDLHKMIAAGTFREDLFYRINVMQIVAPTLRERVQDIPQLAKHFLREYSRLFSKAVLDIESDAITRLQRYCWRGNVRELENVMQRAIVLASGSSVRAEDLELEDEGRQESDETDIGNVVSFNDYNPASTFERQLRDFKLKLATAAIRQNGGNKTLAAGSLGISRAYLHRLVRLDVKEPPFELEMSEEVHG